VIHRLVALAGCLALAATASASAGSVYRQPLGAPVTPAAKSSPSLRAGIVAGNGSIVYGSGFQVSHPQTGEYDITFSGGDFKKCPVISITPAGTGSVAPVANLFGYSCSSSGVAITILMIGSTNGAAEDNAFHFIAVEP
jgi:hypothetical protein